MGRGGQRTCRTRGRYLFDHFRRLTRAIVPAKTPRPTADTQRQPSLSAELERVVLEAQRLAEIVNEQQEVLSEYGVEGVAERQRRIASLAEDITHGEKEIKDLNDQIAKARTELVDTRNQADLQTLGLYDFEHPAESSAVLADKLSRLRQRIRSTNKIGVATTANDGWTVNQSRAKGKKMVTDLSRLMLRAYNAEAENCVKTVKAGNLPTAQKRLQKAIDAARKNGQIIGLEITADYHRLRLEEIELASQHLQTVQIEKELERERRAELREQARVAKELQRERERLEKERNHYHNSIAALESKGDEDGAARLRSELSGIERALANVDYRVANVRAGYVYVVSNLGAFGEEVVKIGLTRRLDPMDRVRELGDASVPFAFDVHALFFSKDAVGVEAMLHREFAAQRVNKINARKEFFRVRPDEVLKTLRNNDVEILEFDPEQKAEHYRLSWPHADDL